MPSNKPNHDFGFYIHKISAIVPASFLQVSFVIFGNKLAAIKKKKHALVEES